MRTRNQQMRLYALTVLLVFSLAAGALFVPATNAAGTPESAGSLAQDNRPVTVTGLLSIWRADTFGLSDVEPEPKVYFSRGDDGLTYILEIDLETALEFDRQIVTITGALDTGAAFSSGTDGVFDVRTIQPAPSVEGGREVQQVNSGAWAVLMCRFNGDASQPHNTAWYNTMFGNAYPGLDHYWRQISYNNVNIGGSTAYGWYELPRNHAYYVPDPNDPDKNRDSKLLDDCVNAADPNVNFANFQGVTMFFNDNLAGVSFSLALNRTLDGVKKKWEFTAIAENMAQQAVVAHEMGHAYGMDHSSGPAGTLPVQQIYVSRWDVMSSPWATAHGTYGPVAQGPIANSLYEVGWIAANRIKTVNIGDDTTFWLERLNQPTTGNYLMAKIITGKNDKKYFTLEARRQSGYDAGIPGNGVLIHEVDQRGFKTKGLLFFDPNEPTALVVDSDGDNDVNDGGAMFVPGEWYVDDSCQFLVEVVSQSSERYQVRVDNSDLLNSPTGSTSAAQPRFRWKKMPGAQSYEIQIDTTYNLDATWGPSNTYTSKGRSFKPPAPLLDRMYYWRIRSVDANGTKSAWSLTCPVHIETGRKNAPILYRYETYYPTLTWNRVTWAAGYEIQVASDKKFNIMRNSNSGLSSSTLSYTTGYLANGTYYWRVRAKRADGSWGGWSDIGEFIVDVR